MGSTISRAHGHRWVVLAEGGRNGGCGGGIRVALRGDDARLPGRGAGGTASATSFMPPPEPGTRLSFTATAYCKGLTTAAGVAVQAGIAAADPALLPVGSIVELDTPDARYDGIYTILDTGPGGPGSRDRHLHVELPRGAPVRAQARSPDRPAPRLEPARDGARVHGPAVPAPGTTRAPVAVAPVAAAAHTTSSAGLQACPPHANLKVRTAPMPASATGSFLYCSSNSLK